MVKRADLFCVLGVKQWNTSSAPESTLQYWAVPWTADRSSLLHLPDRTEGASALYVSTPSLCLCTEMILHHYLMSQKRLMGRRTVTGPERHNKTKQIYRFCWVSSRLSFTQTHDNLVPSGLFNRSQFHFRSLSLMFRWIYLTKSIISQFS